MRLLLLSDQEDPYLWDHYRPGRLDGFDAILSCGDLRPEYLSFLVTMGNIPLLYVHGNHDGRYAGTPPEGCICAEDRVVTVKGLRVLGLGGCPVYNGGPHQYTEGQMRRRIARAAGRVLYAGGVDILLAHAPPKGFGDGSGYAHRGFEAFLPLLDLTRPQYLIHGHVHMNYGLHIPRTVQCGQTTILNAYGRYELEIEPRAGGAAMKRRRRI